MAVATRIFPGPHFADLAMQRWDDEDEILGLGLDEVERREPLVPVPAEGARAEVLPKIDEKTLAIEFEDGVPDPG